jgi:hypothetical protein
MEAWKWSDAGSALLQFGYTPSLYSPRLGSMADAPWLTCCSHAPHVSQKTHPQATMAGPAHAGMSRPFAQKAQEQHAP